MPRHYRRVLANRPQVQSHRITPDGEANTSTEQTSPDQGTCKPKKENPMLKNSTSVPIVAMLAAFALYSMSVLLAAMLAAFAIPGQGHAQGSAPNLSGTYRCSPE